MCNSHVEEGAMTEALRIRIEQVLSENEPLRVRDLIEHLQGADESAVRELVWELISSGRIEIRHSTRLSLA